MSFQVLDDNRQNFLELLDDDLELVILLIFNGRPWLKYFGCSKLLCTRATKAIVNHTPIGKY